MTILRSSPADAEYSRRVEVTTSQSFESALAQI